MSRVYVRSATGSVSDNDGSCGCGNGINNISKTSGGLLALRLWGENLTGYTAFVTVQGGLYWTVYNAICSETSALPGSLKIDSTPPYIADVSVPQGATRNTHSTAIQFNIKDDRSGLYSRNLEKHVEWSHRSRITTLL